MRYDCGRNGDIIARLGRNANTQMARNDGFKNIFPWKKQCDEENKNIHYIAKNPEGLICGWMTVVWHEKFGQKYVYLNEISTRRIKDAFYGGVGQRLHARLVEDARAGGAEFIYLYPLNPGVADIYKKWGYVHARSEIVHMFLLLGGEPNRPMLDSLMPPNPRTVLTALHDFAVRPPKDDEFLKLIEKTRRNILSNPEKIRELTDILETIEGTEFIEESEELPEGERLTLADKREMVAVVLRSVKGGTRKARRNRRTRTKKNF